MNLHKFTSILCLILITMLSACAASQSGSSVSSRQARVANTVSFGTITNLADATIANDPSGIGAIGGAATGGVLGSTIGAGRGRTLAILGGALAGAAAGHTIEGAARRSAAIEITVAMENGQTISVVQELGAEEKTFRVGDRVRVLRGSDGTTRVRR